METILRGFSDPITKTELIALPTENLDTAANECLM